MDQLVQTNDWLFKEVESGKNKSMERWKLEHTKELMEPIMDTLKRMVKPMES